MREDSNNLINLSGVNRMCTQNKLPPIEAAHQFINKHFPNCQGALLAGSVVRGEATETSDLDIIIFDKNICAFYRESLNRHRLVKRGFCT